MDAIGEFDVAEVYGDLLRFIAGEIDNSDEIKNFGVKGMRWGVRKSEGGGYELKSLGPDKVTVTTKNGEQLDLVKSPVTGLHRTLGRMSKKYREQYSNHAALTIRKKDGTKVGEADVARKSKDELYLNWLGIDRKQRGKGYATSVMKAAEKFGRQEGFKKMTLEVPGNSPDARHIYTKLGFKVTKEADPADKDDYWGGLTEMEYTFKHSVDASEFLKHYGVKGMRWGVRTDRPAASGDAVTFKGIKTKARAGGVKSLSNKELQDFIQRANLEQQYHRLNPSAKKKALQFTADILLGVGKQQAMKLAGDVATKQLANLLKK